MTNFGNVINVIKSTGKERILKIFKNLYIK